MNELLEKLRNLDELTLLELLGITSDDLVDNFQNKIEDNFEYLWRELNDLNGYSEEE